MSKKFPPWATTTITMVCLAIIAFLLGQFASLLIESRLSVPRNITLAKEKVQVTSEQKPLSAYESTIMPIFGERKAKPSPKPTDKGDETEATESIGPEWDQILSTNPPSATLRGTLIGSDMAIAILEVNGKDVTVVIGGEAGSYRVDTITKTTVTFRKDNETKTIALNLDSDAVMVAQPVEPEETVTANEDDSENTGEDNLVSYNGDKRVVDRRGFDALLKPPSRLAHDVKFIPNSKEGKPYGIRISYLKPDSFFTKIGLRAGDVLVKTNNKDIKSVEDSFYAYQSFKNEDNLVMEVDRDGKIIQIPLEFR